jgi:hypothetical protein
MLTTTHAIALSVQSDQHSHWVSLMAIRGHELGYHFKQLGLNLPIKEGSS